MPDEKIADLIERVDPWSPDDPLDAMAESFRLQIVDIYRGMERVAVFREMSEMDKLTAFMAGVVTALVGISFAHVSDESRDAIMQAISEYLPHARLNAEGMLPTGFDDR